MIRKLTRVKIYFDRSRAYMSYVQLAMIGVIFVDSVPALQRLADVYPVMVYGLCVLLTLLGALLFGWLDTAIGVRRQEFKDNSEENPILMKILEELKNQ